MPFRCPATANSELSFIGYSRTPRTTETKLENMFVGRPAGNYDRLLDFSRPVTGSLFFVPSGTFLDNVTANAPDAAESARAPSTAATLPAPLATLVAVQDTSLRIGSLKGELDE